jgi:ribonucleotide monophosphatase NagD (HAD superfamily)
MAIPSIDPKIMQQVLGGTKNQLDVISSNYKIVADNLDEIRANERQLMLAVASIYAAIEAIAKKTGTELPKPLIDMSITESEDD